jgi:hypothetical protein
VYTRHLSQVRGLRWKPAPDTLQRAQRKICAHITCSCRAARTPIGSRLPVAKAVIIVNGYTCSTDGAVGPTDGVSAPSLLIAFTVQARRCGEHRDGEARQAPRLPDAQSSPELPSLCPQRSL